jgi:hypothetical protein
MNAYFEGMNTNNEYVRTDPLTIPEGTRVPTVDIKTVENFMMGQKQTSPGPYWVWRDFACYLTPCSSY